jgi:hypothetical protein
MLAWQWSGFNVAWGVLLDATNFETGKDWPWIFARCKSR